MPALTRRYALASAAALLGAPTRAQAPRTLAVGVVSDPVTLDPAFSASFFENAVFYCLHETLLVAAPDGSISPGLATHSNPDPLRHVLTLRPGLTYHDGTTLDAASVKANIDRYMDPATASIRRADFGPLQEVVATGPLTLELRMSAPYAPLPLVLTNRAGMPVSMEALRRLGPDFATEAVGCGAYKFVSWTKNSELVLERFDGYWRGRDHGFDRLVFRPIADETVRLANLRSGTVQLIDAVPPQSVATLARENAIRVSQMPSLGFNAWSMNLTRRPFDDVRVRRAFVAAVDPEVVQKVVYFGTGEVSHGPLSPAVAWAFDKSFKPAGYDPARAKTLLAQAGIAEPVPIAITVTNSPQMVRIAQIAQSQANQAGFKVEVKQVDPTSLITVLRAKDFDVCMSPWSGRYDPDGNMYFWFTKGGPNNFAGYDDAQVTAWLNEARTGSDQAGRVALYHRAQDKLGQDLPMLYLHFDAIIQASSARLRWTQYPDAVFRLYDARMA